MGELDVQGRGKPRGPRSPGERREIDRRNKVGADEHTDRWNLRPDLQETTGAPGRHHVNHLPAGITFTMPSSPNEAQQKVLDLLGRQHQCVDIRPQVGIPTFHVQKERITRYRIGTPV